MELYVHRSIHRDDVLLMRSLSHHHGTLCQKTRLQSSHAGVQILESQLVIHLILMVQLGASLVVSLIIIGILHSEDDINEELGSNVFL